MGQQMGQGNAVVREVRLAEGLTGPQTFDAMFTAKATSAARWALENGFTPPKVSMCINNRRPYPDVRDRLAEFFEMERSEIDALIEGGDGSRQ